MLLSPSRRPVDMVLAPVPVGQMVPYWRIVLRGCSQLTCQTNELTGLLIIAAVAVATPIAAAYLVVAGILAPAVRYVLGERGPILGTGLAGLSPSLTALSLPAFFDTGWTDLRMWGVLVVAAAATAVVTHVIVRLLPLPALALPFLVVFWVIWAIEPSVPELHPLVDSDTSTSGFQPAIAVLDGLGEVAFSPNPWSGALLLAGVLVSNWRHGVMAVTGAVIGTLGAYYSANVATGGLNEGLYGFNSVLTAIAVFALCGGKLRLAVLGALLATILTPAISDLGVVALSAPFVATTWIVLGLGRLEDRFQPKGEAAMPEPAPEPGLVDNPRRRGAPPPNVLETSMADMTASLVLSSLRETIDSLGEDDWEPFRPGVAAHWLYREPGDGPRAVLLRYEPGARVAEHEHVGYEHMYVVEGDEYDEHGEYPAGSLVINPPGTRHSPGSHGGCVALLIYECPVRFTEAG